MQCNSKHAHKKNGVEFDRQVDAFRDVKHIETEEINFSIFLFCVKVSPYYLKPSF